MAGALGDYPICSLRIISATKEKATQMATKSTSPYAKYQKKEYRYPNRERTICACGGILFRGLNDGSPGSVIAHKCLQKRKTDR